MSNLMFYVQPKKIQKSIGIHYIIGICFNMIPSMSNLLSPKGVATPWSGHRLDIAEDHFALGFSQSTLPDEGQHVSGQFHG